MRRWGIDSWGGFAVAATAGFCVALFCGIGWGWLGAVSTIGPTLGVALHVGWRLGEMIPLDRDEGP